MCHNYTSFGLISEFLFSAAIITGLIIFSKISCAYTDNTKTTILWLQTQGQKPAIVRSRNQILQQTLSLFR